MDWREGQISNCREVHAACYSDGDTRNITLQYIIRCMMRRYQHPRLVSALELFKPVVTHNFRVPSCRSVVATKVLNIYDQIC
jgi:hypothetical protein